MRRLPFAGVATSPGEQLRWWLVVVATAIGLIAMHSLVAHPKHDQVTPSPVAMIAAEYSCCADDHAAPPGLIEDKAPHHGSSLMALLHLCLAVLTGFALVAIAALLALVPLGADGSDHR
jgi:hypothetical protein